MLIRIAGETSVCDLLDERNLYDAGPAITIAWCLPQLAVLRGRRRPAFDVGAHHALQFSSRCPTP